MFEKYSILIITLSLLGNSVLSFDTNEYESSINLIRGNQSFTDDFTEHMKYLLKLDPNYLDYKPEAEFDCDVTNRNNGEAPESVHKLRPSDVKVVAALGDSLTAALGGRAHTVLGLLTEYRGISWSIGGDKTVSKVVTLPNILKKFNPKVIGFSKGTSRLHVTSKQLNVAISGQEANHIPTQAQNLVNLIKNSKDISINEDWKVVTLFIGGNDLCDICINKVKHLPENYIKDIREGLDILQANLPKTFVNFVSILNVEDIKDMNRGLFCKEIHKTECPCAAYPSSEADIIKLDNYFKEYTRLSEELVDSGRYDIKDDFTVVLQPFFKEFLSPRLSNGKVDLSYFAPDCFHFSAKSHAYAAVALWNNMLQPIGTKAKTWRLGEKISCPTVQKPYIFTKKNSN